jgi:hypothetical protein
MANFNGVSLAANITPKVGFAKAMFNQGQTPLLAFVSSVKVGDISGGSSIQSRPTSGQIIPRNF